MRKSLVIWAVVIATTACHAAIAESGMGIGSMPDPGLQDNATDKDKIPSRKTPPARSEPNSVKPAEREKRAARVFQDTFDEPIVELPQADLRLTAGETDSKTERLVYDIYVKGLPAGKAEFELKRQEKYGKNNLIPVYAVTLVTRANRLTSTYYDVRDKTSSIFDAKGGFSRLFSMDRKEGNSHVAERITFNYEKDAMNATYSRPRADPENQANWATSTIALTGKALDPLSAIYFMRSSAINLKNIVPGKSKPAFTLPVCSDRHVWNSKLYAVSIDHPDVGSLKNRECVVFEVEAPFRGLFEHVGKVRVWFDVETGVVVKMMSEISIGSAEAILNLDESSNSPLNR